MLISTLEMRIRIHITIVLSLMTIVIVVGVGPSAGLPRNYQDYGAPDWDVSWSPGRYYSSERRDQKEWRDAPETPEPRNTPDRQILFRQLDDLERMEDKSKIPAPNWLKNWAQPEDFQDEPIIGSDLVLDDSFPHIPSEGTGQDSFLDTSDYLGLGNMNEKANENSAGLRESNRKMGLYWGKDRDEAPEPKDDSFPHIPSEGTGQDTFLDTSDYLGLGNMNEKANDNSAGLRESNRKMGLYWGIGRDEAPEPKDPYSPIWPDSPSFPVSNPLTSGNRSPIFCQSDYPPSRPDTTKQTDPPQIPTKSPHTSKPKHSKCRKKSRTLDPEMVKELLEIIMDTKLHVLSTLKILNQMENEVLGHSPEDCPLQDLEHDCGLRLKERPAPKKMPERLEKPLESPTWRQFQDFSFGKLPSSQRISVAALALEEKPKQQEPVWEEHHQDPTPARRLIVTNKSWKHRYHGQKERPKMNRIPPGMVAILV